MRRLNTGPRLSSAALVGLAGVLLAPAAAQAQLSEIPGTGYARRTETAPYTGCPGTVDRLTEGDGGGVKQTFDRDLPFPIQFYGQTQSSITIFSGGAIAFPRGKSITINNTALGSASDPNGFLAIWWDDLELLTNNNGFLGVSVTGTAPNREYCIEWNNFNQEFTNASRVNFKAVLYEGSSGRIDIHYGPVTGSMATYSATMGMEDQAGGRAFDIRSPGCSPSCVQADITAMVDRRVTLIAPLRDVVAVGVDAPRFGFSGASNPVEVQVANQDDETIGPFEIAMRVADNPAMQNAVSGGSTSLTLAPFESRTASVDVTIPSTFPVQSRVYFELTVDVVNVVAEADENNNVVVSRDSTLLLPGAPDLAVTSVRTGARQVSVGDTFDVVVRVQNRGSEEARNAGLAVVLSTNPVVTGRDARLASTTLTLAAGASTTSTLAVTIPANTRSGRYVFGAVVDPDGLLSELDENNNGRATARPIDVSGDDIAIVTTRLPAAVVGEAYTGFVAAAGGSGTYRFELTSGALPMGMGLVAETGAIFGRPTTVGESAFTVQVTDVGGSGATTSAQLTLGVRASPDDLEPLTVVTRDLPPALIGQAYEFPLVATGGQVDASSLVWSAGAGLPSGIVLSTAGVLSGTAESAGSYEVEVTVASGALSATRRLTLDVLETTGLQIVAEALPAARIGESYEHVLRAFGGSPPITWRLEQGRLEDAGLDLSVDGRISGTPTRAGPVRFTVVARDNGPPGRALVDSSTFVIDVASDDALQITTESLPVGRVETGYDRAVAAVGGLPPYEWRLVTGRLPEGLTGTEFAQTNEFRIVGTPTEAAVSNLLIEATDAEGRVQRKALRLEILAREVVASPAPDDNGCRAAAGSRSSLPAGLVIALLGVLFTRRRRSA